jgi:glyoxylase I family protein
MTQLGQEPDRQGSPAKAQGFVRDMWGIRYQVADVAKSIDFYTNKLGFKLDHGLSPAWSLV